MMCNACGVKIVGEKLRMADMLKKKPGEAEGFAVDFANRRLLTVEISLRFFCHDRHEEQANRQNSHSN